jgi:hypothetical protein
MKLITSKEYSAVRDELNEFVVLCNKNNYNPTRADFKDIIEFLLLYTSADTTVCESVLLDSLYKDYYSINEDSTMDNTKDFDSAVGMAGAAVKGVAKGAAVAAAATGAAVAIGAASVGSWIKYLFKKGKVKKAVAAEFKGEMDKLKEYELLNKLIGKKAKLEGKDTWTAEYPGLAKS